MDLDKLCKIVTKDKFMFLTTPEGEILPNQGEMTLKNNVDGIEGTSEVTVTLLADTRFIKNHITLHNTEIDSEKLQEEMKKRR